MKRTFLFFMSLVAVLLLLGATGCEKEDVASQQSIVGIWVNVTGNEEHVPVKTDDSRYHMHHKFGVVDNRMTFSGSYNWTYTAQNHNQENLVITTNFTIVQQFIEEYESLWHQMVWLKPHRNQQ